MAAFRFGLKVRSEVRCWLACPYIILTPASKRAAEQKLATNWSLFSAGRAGVAGVARADVVQRGVFVRGGPGAIWGLEKGLR